MRSIASLFFATIVCLLLAPLNMAAEEAQEAEAKKPARPNVVIIFADDLGYGDLSCYGHPTINTPNLDKMAKDGQRWTSFYVAASMCTPSRAGLMTGRLPIRTGMCSIRRHVLYPDSGGGLPQSEVTLAEMFKGAGYKTACVGKWHLGHLPQFLPCQQGFDQFFGLPYSNDMWHRRDIPRNKLDKSEYFTPPLMRGDKIIERPVKQETLTKRYTAEAIKFIEKNQDQPFFLYLAQTFPHTPLFRSKEFVDHSMRGLFGDTVEEVDWSVGQILDTLKRLKLDKNTLVIFTSDNGPWEIQGVNGGSAGLLRGWKGSTFEGGMREPAIFWWPETIKPAIVRDMGSTLDLMPTLAKICGGKTPTGRVLDGYDISPVLLGTGSSPRDTMFYYRGALLCAVRQGPYKMYYRTQHTYRGRKGEVHDPPWLFNLNQDPSEKYEIGKKHPEIIAKLDKLAKEHTKKLGKVPPSQLDIKIKKKKK